MIAEEEELRKEWHIQLEGLSASYNDLFTKAGILPNDDDYDSDDDSILENQLEPAISNEKEMPFESISDDASPNMRIDSLVADKPKCDNRVANILAEGHVDVLSTTDDNNNVSKLLSEAQLQYRTYLAKLALQDARQAHDVHRTRYNQFFAQYGAKHPGQTVDELATSFGPIFLRRGQQLTGPLRVAEDALAELEKSAIDRGFYTVTADQVDPAVNPYLDDEELAAICAGRNYDHIWNWLDVEGGMDPPEPCPSEAPQTQSTYSCVGQDNVVCQRSGPGASTGSSSENTGPDVALVCSESGAASRVGKRKFKEEIEVCDSFSVIAEGDKRQKIDAWRLESYRRRPTIL
ncbi:hypothetical protein PtrSN002B_009138 [Pyrenophora tritici-repentis]|nr:hypothetical protein PtrV1_12566 [Pyrenophora tritici-repentis]KAF7445378.1 hypothetical protein A1F99_103640 [Pyrenophora tritici-repentis]KAF7565643.1 hypothetical protein PtrM4_050770 [Pyrenophora tritici-repentis]KAI0573640.1 hypothetical protein Alg215_09079 [Pyrenophora tritici-repentis]KAI1512694.1 hypothetical protein Ptr86124_008660 [Pyrenophora tritici-repentis]